MIWLTWRQHRAEAGVGAALLAAAVAALVVIGQGAHHLARQLGQARLHAVRRRLRVGTR
ncbi:MAG TPA: hypothetical protein VGJ38_04265 [Jatrophihabitantaceae bacterium]|jgi:hypothetical protein